MIDEKSFQNSVNTPENNGGQAERTIEMQMAVIAHHQATTVAHPTKVAFNLPALTVTNTNPDGATAFGLGSLPTGESRNG
jgi:hypothetical protein